MSTNKVLVEIIEKNLNNLWTLISDILAYIYSQNSDSQLSVFIAFLKNLDYTDFDFPEIDDHFNLSDDEYQTFRDVSRTKTRILQNLINANISEDEFYEKIWNKLNDSDLFPNPEDKTALLLTLWLDTRIPYYQLGESCSMENDEYKEIIELLSPKIKKARFIVYSGIEQKTQRTSLLMDVSDTIEDYRQKVVFWSYVISLITKFEANQLVVQAAKNDEEKSKE